MEYLWPGSVRCYFAVIRCTSFKMACNPTTGDHRAKPTEMSDSGVHSSKYMGYLCVLFKVIWGLLGVVFWKWLTRKRPIIELNRPKYGTGGTYRRYIWPCSVQDHFEIIGCTYLKMKTENRMVVERNRVIFRDTSNTYVGCFRHCCVQGYIGFIRCTCLKISCNSKAVDHTSKRTEIWVLRIIVDRLGVPLPL